MGAILVSRLTQREPSEMTNLRKIMTGGVQGHTVQFLATYNAVAYLQRYRTYPRHRDAILRVLSAHQAM